VPDATIRRRYQSGLRNFFNLYRSLTTTWRMYDNSAVLWGRILAEARAEG